MSENEDSGKKPRVIVINPLRLAMIVAVVILLLALPFILFFPQQPWIGSYSTFNIVQKSTSTNYTLTVVSAIGGSWPVLISRSDLWIEPKDSFLLTIPLENITSKWSHDVMYLDTNNDSYVSPGDLMILQKPLYGTGTFVRIMNLDASVSSERVCASITLS